MHYFSTQAHTERQAEALTDLGKVLGPASNKTYTELRCSKAVPGEKGTPRVTCILITTAIALHSHRQQEMGRTHQLHTDSTQRLLGTKEPKTSFQVPGLRKKAGFPDSSSFLILLLNQVYCVRTLSLLKDQAPY